ncbi:MAG: DUF4167 domain-containing protein [Aestuariivita sp.]|nr:DUF4167 domain-containing protein [Aestuariivita sp.]MCY4201135.1 DUF4167 domain-containing protein [Aestuariivita sp.]MCY4287800.1 DUF4167 domain-containing protein [Aestuariivita sp.]MCY4345966.1 DUF4167 domain-containing protein [Aestuariivita sp.]
MRSSKSRSRTRANRNRPSGGNVVNRVFESSGPEGKVRGTPQQIIEKYSQLARDAQLSNDRVATENFHQHAEHYLRLLSDAQREIESRREDQDRQNRERQQGRDRQDRQGRAANGKAAHFSASATLPATNNSLEVVDTTAPELEIADSSNAETKRHQKSEKRRASHNS